MSDNNYRGNVSQFPLRSTLANGRLPPDPPDMEARIQAVEVDLRDIKAVLNRIEPILVKIDAGVRKIESDTARLDGRISQLPSTVQLIGFVIAVLVAGSLIKHFFP
jgi:hypothetical protein